MPRPRNLACLNCATESAEVAQLKPCWKGQTCRARRSYYLKHSVNKAKKRSRQRSDRVEQIKTLDIPIFGYQPAPEVLMTFYRDRADGPIHALEFAVIDQGETVANVNTIHLKGVPQAKLRSHIKSVLGILDTQYGPDMAVSQSRQPAKLCPLCQREGGTNA